MLTTTRPVAPSSLIPARLLAGLDRRLLHLLAARLHPAALRFALGGESVSASASPPVATIRFADRRALVGLAVDPERAFGDAFAEGRIEVDGDLVAALEAAYRGLEDGHPSWLRRVALDQRHSLRRDRGNIHRHYDLGNDFYAQWLDGQLVYTGAYFDSPVRSLEEAQVAKMDHVCRKLGLQPGETVVEAGCGWGALALHMARHYGVRVRAFNISREQVRLARDRAREQGLEDRVTFVEEDYRRIDGPADVFVSVGMLEHVGRGQYGELAAVIARCLAGRRGRGLLHFIGRDAPLPLNAWIRRRIFPGAYAPTLEETFRGVLAPAGMSVLDVENLRLHYALTLRHWRERYERAVAEGRIGFDERFRRAWRLYLAGSEAAFSTGSLQLFQVLFAPHGSRAVPWTRAGLYRGGGGLAWNGPRS